MQPLSAGIATFTKQDTIDTVGSGMISIIIPTLNEAAAIEETVLHTLEATDGAEVELIVSDCDSADGTARLARELDVQVVCGGHCRAAALNLGASRARGDVLLFLHADSYLPQNFPGLIRRALQSREIVGGAFDFEFSDHPQAGRLDAECLRWVVLCNRIRYRWTGNFYGDQSIFVRRDIWDRIGGFPQMRLMEDVRFSQRLQCFGRTAILRPPVHTSPRRFLTNGVIRQFIKDLTLLGCDSVGICPELLWERYNGWNRSRGCKAATSG